MSKPCIVYSCPKYQFIESHMQHVGNIISGMIKSNITCESMEWKCPLVSYLNIVVF